MITFEPLTLDSDFEVWDIFYNGIKVGYLRKSDKLYLEVLYDKYKLRLNQRDFIKPIIRLMCGLIDLKVLSDMYIPTHTLSDWKRLTEGAKKREGFTIKN